MSSLFRIRIGTIRKSFSRVRGQSLVEIAIALPVILILLSGMIELGFMLNYYLSLLDSTREAARLFSNSDPFLRDEYGNPIGDNLAFYQGVAGTVVRSLQPANAQDTSRKIVLDSASDDIVVTVFSVDGTIPTRMGEYHWFDNQPSAFNDAEIASRLNGSAPPTGILLVEVYYDYHQVLALPWITAFIPNPTMLHAYTMMPISAAEPTPTPSSP
jgi:hypothetical protein